MSNYNEVKWPGKWNAIEDNTNPYQIIGLTHPALWQCLWSRLRIFLAQLRALSLILTMTVKKTLSRLNRRWELAAQMDQRVCDARAQHFQSHWMLDRTNRI
ncbi:hypothetical protein WDW86_05405 [Bdellovibrionota bacterium FG-2]